MLLSGTVEGSIDPTHTNSSSRLAEVARTYSVQNIGTNDKLFEHDLCLSLEEHGLRVVSSD
jgi:hypothetical protein